ncbi:putative transcription factor bZIP family [Dioscorea sansibarensis]
MPSVSARQSSGSEEDQKTGIDERKRKRMLSNRESARRSRMKKQQHLDDLISQATQLKNENSQILMQINLLTQQFSKVDMDNTVLRTQVMELTDRLQSLNSVLRFVEEFSGMAMDIPEIPDPLLKPWQLPCPAMPITAASASMFQC